ncbi:uncharacterized protein DFL_005463 [Arthrobotrys flagrans]|uniref:Putative gamma-glutamylcyclotransferase n=1 Tax=Arthrobotrys flagrans TaxID=97331 RepID=A0A436ZXH3_ARTFL|nr:hypothetical protein DFL_005463 [Arthrobotrys flagrans]
MVDELLAKDYIDEADWASLSSIMAPQPQPDLRLAFKPTLFFFYGTLTIPEVLRRILGLNEPPILLNATTRLFKLKLWGPYPALVAPSAEEDPKNRVPVPGVACTIETEEQLNRLVAYEGENYTISETLVELHDTRNANGTYAKTFIWKGYPEELTDGFFDVAAFKNY